MVDIVLIVVAYYATRDISLVPGGLQNLMEIVVEYFYDLAESIAGKAADNFISWAMTIFLLLISND
ncbi:MAG: F0F1 ATP synthase subunit A [Caldilineaceae bacterium]